MKQQMKEHPLVTIFLLFLMVVALPFGVVANMSYNATRKAQATADRLVDFQVFNKVEGCESSNNSRKAIQRVLDGASQPSGIGAVDFSLVEGYDDLSPEVQFFLNNLQVLTNRPGGANLEQLADDYRETNPSNQDCDKIGKALRKELTNG